MSLMYVDKWVLHKEGNLEASFHDSTGMKIITSAVVGVDELNIVSTDAGCAYALGEPLYQNYWPGHIPARAINEAFYSAILQFQNNIRGDSLWMIFQDELATVFAGSR